MSFRRGVANTTGLLLLALALFYSTRYWPQRIPLLPETPGVAEESSRPDYVITDFHTIDLDEGGRIRYELAATQLAHFARPERAELVAPDMVFYRDKYAGNQADAPATAPAAASSPDAPPPPQEDSPWQLTSATGVITEAGLRLDLAGDVRLARLRADDSAGMTLETSKLTVHGKRESAQTDQPFVLKTLQGQLTGTGMDIDLKRGRINLHAQVRGQYDPS